MPVALHLDRSCRTRRPRREVSKVHHRPRPGRTRRPARAAVKQEHINTNKRQRRTTMKLKRMLSVFSVVATLTAATLSFAAANQLIPRENPVDRGRAAGVPERARKVFSNIFRNRE